VGRGTRSRDTPSSSSKKSGIRMRLEQYSPSLVDVALTLFVFGLLVWLYVVAIQITHPNWLGLPMTRYGVPPFAWRVDDTGVVAFAVAAFGFFIWRIELKRSNHAL
jgi:hypothetical protein